MNFNLMINNSTKLVANTIRCACYLLLHDAHIFRRIIITFASLNTQINHKLIMTKIFLRDGRPMDYSNNNTRTAYYRFQSDNQLLVTSSCIAV